MRVSYDRRGRIRGYSGGVGTYYWFQGLELVFLLLVVIPVVLVLMLVALVCVLGWGIASLLRKPAAAASWRSAAASVGRATGRFGEWSDRQQGGVTRPHLQQRVGTQQRSRPTKVTATVAPLGRTSSPTAALKPAATRTASTASELERLAKLHRSGALDDLEFAAAKAQVLGDGHQRTVQSMERWRSVAGQTLDSLYVGAYVIDAQTQTRGQVEHVLPDGSGLVRLDDGTVVKTAPASPPTTGSPAL